MKPDNHQAVENEMSNTLMGRNIAEFQKAQGGRPNNIRRSEIDEEMLSKILGGAAAAGTGYLIYRGARMLPSLLPPLWPTIPANIIAP